MPQVITSSDCIILKPEGFFKREVFETFIGAENEILDKAFAPSPELSFPSMNLHVQTPLKRQAHDPLKIALYPNSVNGYFACQEVSGFPLPEILLERTSYTAPWKCDIRLKLNEHSILEKYDTYRLNTGYGLPDLPVDCKDYQDIFHGMVAAGLWHKNPEESPIQWAPKGFRFFFWFKIEQRVQEVRFFVVKEGYKTPYVPCLPNVFDCSKICMGDVWNARANQSDDIKDIENTFNSILTTLSNADLATGLTSALLTFDENKSSVTPNPGALRPLSKTEIIQFCENHL